MVRPMFMAILMSFGSWILEMGKRCAKGALVSSRRILTRIFLREPDPVGWLPIGKSVHASAYLKHLGRLGRREEANARDLGSLADAVRRQGLQEHARRLARGAFGAWCRSRKVRERLGQTVEHALRDHAL
jgi:hypothetical protein